MSKKLSSDELDGGKLWLAWYGLVSLAKEGPATRKELFLAGTEAKKFVNDIELNAILSKSSWQKQYADALVESGVCRLGKEDNKQVYEVADEALLRKILSIQPHRGNQYLNCLLFPSRYGSLVRWLEAERGTVSLEEEGTSEEAAEEPVEVVEADAPKPKIDIQLEPEFVPPPAPTPLTEEEIVTKETLELDENAWMVFKTILNNELNIKFNLVLDVLRTNIAVQDKQFETIASQLNGLTYLAKKNESLLAQFQKDLNKLQGDTDVAKDLRMCIDNAQAFTSLATDVLSKLDGKQ